MRVHAVAEASHWRHAQFWTLASVSCWKSLQSHDVRSPIKHRRVKDSGGGSQWLDKTWPEADNTNTGTSLHSSAPSFLPVESSESGENAEQEASSAWTPLCPGLRGTQTWSCTDSRQCGARVITTLVRLKAASIQAAFVCEEKSEVSPL